MSLLEELFLDDEAGEAERLERVLEEGEDDLTLSEEEGGPRGEDEAEEEKVRVDPTQTKAARVVKNPKVVLNPARLTGPRGIQAIPEHFKNFKFKGKSHEREDVDLVLKKLEHWAHRLYPRFQFDDCLKKIEQLGSKRVVAVQLHKIRSDQILSDEIVHQKDSSDEEAPAPGPAPEDDEFDKLLQQQIELTRATPGPSSAKKPFSNAPVLDRSILMPKATSSPSISDDQKERMIRNRQLAEERRLARMRLKANHTNETVDNYNETIDLTNFNPALNLIGRTIIEETVDITEETVQTDTVGNNEKINTTSRSAIIDSSDDEMETNANKRAKTFNQRVISDSDDENGVFNEVGNAIGNASIERNVDERDFEMLADNTKSSGQTETHIVKGLISLGHVTTYNAADSSDEDFEMQDRNVPLKERDSKETEYNEIYLNKDKTNNSRKELTIHYSDSSDSECEVTPCNTSVIADVHINPASDTHTFPNVETNKANAKNVEDRKDGEINVISYENIEVNNDIRMVANDHKTPDGHSNKENTRNALNLVDKDNKWKELAMENETESSDFEMGDVDLNAIEELEAQAKS